MKLKAVPQAQEFVYHNSADREAWFFAKYYLGGANFRYPTFRLALNLLFQLHTDPLILETGCQRQKGDFGAGMSTSIFGEYVRRYGGRVVTVDVDKKALEVCRDCTREFAGSIEYVHSDSVAYLQALAESPALLYLDSLDYDETDAARQLRAQQHCLAELLAAEPRLTPRSVVLLDDNDFPGGGKPLLAKKHLAANGWICLLEWQQSLWVKRP